MGRYTSAKLRRQQSRVSNKRRRRTKIILPELPEAIKEILDGYSVEVAFAVDNAAEEMAEDVVSTLEHTGGYQNRTGKYRGSFIFSKMAGGMGFEKKQGHFVAYSEAPFYRLTHLLEHGKTNRDGGMSNKFPHWTQAQARIETEFANKLFKHLEAIET